MIIPGEILGYTQLETNKNKRAAGECKNGLFHIICDTGAFEVLEDLWPERYGSPTPRPVTVELKLGRWRGVGCILLLDAVPRFGVYAEARCPINPRTAPEASNDSKSGAWRLASS